MSSLETPLTLREWTALGVVLVAWSINYLAVRLGVVEFPVWIALTIRFGITSLLLIPFYRITKAQIKPIFWVMLTLAPGHFAFLFYALALTDSVGSISIMIQIAPAFSVLLAWVVVKDVPGARRLTGLAIAFLGVVYLLYEPNIFNNIPAALTALAAAFFLGLYPLVLKKAGKIHPLAIVGWLSLFAMPITLFMALVNHEFSGFNFAKVSYLGWGGVIYSAIGSSIIAHGTWAWLIQRQPISKLAPMMLLVPILVVILSVLAFNETITLRFITSSAIVLMGILLITKSKAYK